jgi:LacI family transcriptional regulator
MARVTLQDVATKAGVSLATASKVMNGRGDVKDTTRELVSGIADELGYSPRPRSNGASTQRDPYLVIVFDTLSIPYSVQVLSGVQDAATRAGVDVVDATPRIMGRQWFRGIAAAGCLAVITVTMKVDARQGSWARANNLPFIAIDPLTPEGNPTLDGIAVRISATNWAGARAATQHLADLGHQRIGIVTGPMSSAPSRERLEGYRTALEAAGIPFDPDLHRAAPNYSFEDGRIAAQELLDSDADPTAILACSDTIALGTLRAAQGAGRSVPADLSVVSFDDTPLTSWSTPQLTAVNQPLFSMGQVAAERGLALATDPERFAHPFQLETTLVVRDSTAQPR